MGVKRDELAKRNLGAKYALAYRRADGTEVSLRTPEYWSSLRLAKAAAREKNERLRAQWPTSGRYIVIEL